MLAWGKTMTAPKHSVGPWHAKPETNHVPAQVWDDNGQQLAEVYGETRAARKANAATMAAAPDLLLQLKALVVQIEASGYLIVPPGVRAAIEKAEKG